MHLAHLRLRDFRNYVRLDADFAPGFHVLLGNNAQGKTNILEAIYLIATYRSFRGSGGAQMVRQGQTGYFVGARIVGQGEHNVRIYWSRNERKLALDSRPIRKLSEYLGVLRAVVFCSEDAWLVKGPGSRRRRFLDLLLAQTEAAYLPLLQRYVRAVRARNALLKQRSQDEASMESFTREVTAAGREILKFRELILPRFLPMAQRSYASISGGSEELRIDYQSTVKNDFEVELARNRERERILRTTVIGPHRDDLKLSLNGLAAADYASEGQKRSLVIALKMAQAEYLTLVHGVPPILLIDDIMGELDLHRRSGFLPLLQQADRARSQVFMTCTEENWPRELTQSLARWEVKAGKLNRLDPH